MSDVDDANESNLTPPSGEGLTSNGPVDSSECTRRIARDGGETSFDRTAMISGRKLIWVIAGFIRLLTPSYRHQSSISESHSGQEMILCTHTPFSII